MNNPIYDFAEKNNLPLEVLIDNLVRNYDKFHDTALANGLTEEDFNATMRFITFTEWFTDEIKFKAIMKAMAKSFHDEVRKEMK